jgi:hypothetical protein
MGRSLVTRTVDLRNEPLLLLKQQSSEPNAHFQYSEAITGRPNELGFGVLNFRSNVFAPTPHGQFSTCSLSVLRRARVNMRRHQGRARPHRHPAGCARSDRADRIAVHDEVLALPIRKSTFHRCNLVTFLKYPCPTHAANFDYEYHSLRIGRTEKFDDCAVMTTWG